MNIEAESASALEDVIKYYETKGIEVNTPIKIVKKEQFTDGVMALSKTIKEKKGLTQPEVMDKLFSYEVIAEFLDIKISKEKIIDSIIKNNKISNEYCKKCDVEIIYGDKLSKKLESVKNPKKQYRIILSHEIWHLIEHEKKVYSGLISEGTATYAMTAYGNNINSLDKILEKSKTKGFTNFEELTYMYCAAIVKNELGTLDIKRLLDQDIRKKISIEYKKNLLIRAPKIFAIEMKTTPWTFRSYINDFFDIENKQDFFINELEKSELYTGLIPKDKNKIIQTYGMIQERIRRKK